MKGFVTLAGITTADGKKLAPRKALEYGWVTTGFSRQPQGWGLDRDEVPLGHNLIVDQGRQCAAYAFGFRAPVANYVIGRFGVGTGVTVARVTDVSLEAPIILSTGLLTKAVDVIDFVAPFVLRVSCTLGTADANGYVLSELGLFSANNTLLARKVQAVSINKTSDFSPTLVWRLRF